MPSAAGISCWLERGDAVVIERRMLRLLRLPVYFHLKREEFIASDLSMIFFINASNLTIPTCLFLAYLQSRSDS